MYDWLLISIAILVIAIVVGIFIVVLFWKKQKEGSYKEPNYHIFYIFGIALIIIGLCLMVISLLINYSFITAFPIFIIGIVYFIIGQTHRGTWEKK